MGYISANKTKLTGALLVAFGFIQTQSETLRALLTPERFAWVTMAIGLAVAVLGFLNSGGSIQPPGENKQQGRASVGLLVLLGIVGLVAACGSLNPFQYAKTPLDKAHVALRTLENVQLQVLVLVNDHATPPGVVSVLKQTSRDATVAATELGNAVLEFEAARGALIAGGPTASGRLQVANEKLLQWTQTLLARISSIKAAVKGAR